MIACAPRRNSSSQMGASADVKRRLQSADPAQIDLCVRDATYAGRKEISDLSFLISILVLSLMNRMDQMLREVK